jgi:hypothetical protein
MSNARFGLRTRTGQISSIVQNSPFISVLLDTFPNAAAAYSLRLLRSAYTGSAIRVRRSNDNAEQDIAFDNGGNLDTSALTSFVGANNGFVVTWYDQSGNARNATQSTAGNQPQIVSSGSVILNNGKPSLEFNGTSSSLNATDFQTASYTNITTFLVVNFASTTGTQNIFGKYVTTTNNRAFFIGQTSGNWHSNISEDGSSGTVVNIQSANNGPSGTNLHTTIHTMGEVSAIDDINFWRNGTQTSKTLVSGSNRSSIFDAVAPFEIGALNNGSASFLNGKMIEIIFYESDKGSNRTGIESNINTYYAIY